MLHIIAFIVIGLVVGWVIGSMQGKSNKTMAIVLGLVGGLVGGYIFHVSKYGSLGTAIIGAVILGFVGRSLGSKSSA